VIDNLLDSIGDGLVREIRVGAFWTAVVVEADGKRRCGLASNLRNSGHCHHGEAAVGDAGQLMKMGARELSELARSESLQEASIGMAAINGLLSLREASYVELNADEVIARYGKGKRVALVGDFPFIPRLRDRVGSLTVLELQPRDGQLSSDAASDVLPHADVAAITGATLVNHTFDGLMALCPSEAVVLVLGPSTPLAPALFDHGVDILSGSIVIDIDSVLQAVGQGANFRQIRKQGVRLVTMTKDGFPL